jgi:bifunctional non-homologous end joining protein LigD
MERQRAKLMDMIAAKSTSVPSGPDWLHEIKFDGYHLRVERARRGAGLISIGW